MQQHYISHAMGLYDSTTFIDLTFGIHHILGLFFLTRKGKVIVPIHVILCTFRAPLTDIWCVFTIYINFTSMYAWVMLLGRVCGVLDMCFLNLRICVRKLDFREKNEPV